MSAWVSRERVEAIVKGNPGLYLAMLGMAVGIAVTAWTTIATVDLTPMKFAGFIGAAIATTILSIVFGVKSYTANTNVQDRLAKMFPKTP